ncbi:hypothetical protein ABHI18_001846 [Aspergillus niger]
MIALQNHAILPPPAKVDISLLLKPQDEEEAASVTTAPGYPPSAIPPPSVAPALPVAAPASLSSVPPVPQLTSKIPATVPAKRLQPAHTAESPAKKQSKWSPEEDALIIELRGSGMKWEDISKRLPGRSAISCRLHYQNYLERRSEWDEDKKNKLARLYERFKAEMWSKVAEEMAIPWRAAEAMHWQLGEQEMIRQRPELAEPARLYLDQEKDRHPVRSPRPPNVLPWKSLPLECLHLHRTQLFRPLANLIDWGDPWIWVVTVAILDPTSVFPLEPSRRGHEENDVYACVFCVITNCIALVGGISSSLMGGLSYKSSSECGTFERRPQFDEPNARIVVPVVSAMQMWMTGFEAGSR